VLEITAGNVLEVDSHSAVRFHKFKTSGIKDPYTIHIPSDSQAAQWLALAATQTWRTTLDGDAKIFTEDNWREILPVKFDIRALRRTGLITLAQLLDIETLLTISRHSSQKTLEIYLQNGIYHGVLAQKQIAAIGEAERTHPPTIVSIMKK
jgi:hypothetical protein